MNFTDFKVMVAAFMQRDASAFVVGTCDFLLHAINMARRASERKRDFEMSRTQAQVSVSLTAGASLSNAKLVSSPATTVSIKTIRKAWVPDHNNSTYYPIRVVSREKFVAMADRAYQNHSFDRSPVGDSNEFVLPHALLVREADTVALAPYSTTAYGNPTDVLIKMDVIRWLADYTGTGTETDFFLEYCIEYMLFKTVSLLQPFLKEDVRVPLALAELEAAWKSVVSWDSQLITAGSSDDASLD